MFVRQLHQDGIVESLGKTLYVSFSCLIALLEVDMHVVSSIGNLKACLHAELHV